MRNARERAGLTLDAIAASTKIKASLLAELERNDLSHWPHGIYRRAFFRAYAAALGIESDPLVAEFVRLFPDDGWATSVAAPAATGEMRLTLAAVPRSRARPVLASLAAALIDLCLVLGLAGVLRWPIGVDFWMAVSAVALVYFSVPTVFSRRTPGVWWVSDSGHTVRRVPAPAAAPPREPLRIVPPPATLPRRPHSSEAVEEEHAPLRAASG
jgi:hypothetical protein